MKNFPGFGGHETVGKGSSLSGGLSHTGSTDEFKVIVVFGIVEVHGALCFVVSSNLEGDNLELWDSRSHGKDPSAVSVIIDVFLSVWVAHTSGVSSDNVELSASDQSSLGVPLDLSGTSVGHWGWPDGNNSGLGVKDLLLKDGVVLLHSPLEWDIIGLGPATEGVEEKDWLLVTTLLQLLGGVGHEESVTIVDWVSELEDKDGIGAELFESGSELEWSFSVLVESVVPLDSVKSLEITTDEPVSLLVDFLDVWVVDGVCSPGSGTSLLLSVSVEFWVSKNTVGLSFVTERNGLGVLVGLLEFSRNSEADWDRLVVGLAVFEQAVEVERLEHLILSHETVKWGGPSFGEDLEPFEIHLGHLDLGKSLGLSDLGVLLGSGDEKLLDFWGSGLGSFKNTVVVEGLDDLGDASVDAVFAGLDDALGVEWWFIGRVDSGESLNDSSSSLLVKALDVSVLADREGSVNVTLNKGEFRVLVNSPGEVSVLAEGGDEGDKADDSGIGEELGDLSDSADVLLSVGKRESEILVESVSDVVTVEDVCGDTLGDKVLLELHGDGGFTGSGETGEPDSAAVEATCSEGLGSLVSVHLVGMDGNVRGFHLSRHL